MSSDAERSCLIHHQAALQDRMGVILQQPSSATNDALMSKVLAEINQVSALLRASAGDPASLLTESFSTPPLSVPSSDLILSDLGEFTEDEFIEDQLDFDGSDLSIGSLGSTCSVPLVLSAPLSSPIRRVSTPIGKYSFSWSLF